MKRLESHQRKSLNKNLFLISLALVILIIFIFTVGIKALLGSAVFISQLTKKGQSETLTSKKDDFFGNIDVTSIPSATNSSTITISGRVLNYDLVEFFLNDKKVDQIEVVDSFENNIDDLQDGDNEIYLIAKSKKNKSTEKTTNFSVFVKKQKPMLEISEPKDGAKTANDEIKIVGKTDKEVIIEINNQPVVVNVLGEFLSSVKLQTGENKIVITALDIAGNTETKEIKIIYEKD